MRLLQGSAGRVLPEGTPVRFGKMDTQCERERKVGKIRFIARNMMGTEVSGREETSKINYAGEFCRFRITGTYTMMRLTLVFKTLIPDWQIIISGGHVDTVGPEQDVSLETRTAIPSPRIIEERGRGTYIRKSTDLHHILDHQGKPGRSIRLGVGLWDFGTETGCLMRGSRPISGSIIN
jgi:hypothetical protein